MTLPRKLQTFYLIMLQTFKKCAANNNTLKMSFNASTVRALTKGTRSLSERTFTDSTIPYDFFNRYFCFFEWHLTGVVRQNLKFRAINRLI